MLYFFIRNVENNYFHVHVIANIILSAMSLQTSSHGPFYLYFNLISWAKNVPFLNKISHAFLSICFMSGTDISTQFELNW